MPSLKLSMATLKRCGFTVFAGSLMNPPYADLVADEDRVITEWVPVAGCYLWTPIDEFLSKARDDTKRGVVETIEKEAA